MNLSTTDVERFQFGGMFVNYLWEAPLETLVILYFGLDQVGVSFLSGFAALVLLVPMQVQKKNTVLSIEVAYFVGIVHDSSSGWCLFYFFILRKYYLICMYIIARAL